MCAGEVLGGNRCQRRSVPGVCVKLEFSPCQCQNHGLHLQSRMDWAFGWHVFDRQCRNLQNNERLSCIQCVYCHFAFAAGEYVHTCLYLQCWVVGTGRRHVFHVRGQHVQVGQRIIALRVVSIKRKFFTKEYCSDLLRVQRRVFGGKRGEMQRVPWQHAETDFRADRVFSVRGVAFFDVFMYKQPDCI